MLRRCAVHAAVLASYTALSLLHLHPFALHFTTTLPRAVREDVLLHGWILAWSARQLLRAPWDLFDANAFFPYPDSLAYTEHLVPEALPVAPLYALTRDPVLTYNAAYLLIFVLAGWGMFLLARRLTGDPLAAWVAGAFCCYFPAKRWNLAHINTLAVHGVPFALLALHRLLAFPGRRGRAVVAGLAVAFASLASAYFTVYFPLLLLFGVPLLWWAEGFSWEWRRARAVAAAGLVAAAAAAPVLFPYVRVWMVPGGVHAYELQVAGAADVGELFILDSRLWGGLLLPGRLDDLTSPFFPGVTGLLLLGVALLGHSRNGTPQPAPRRHRTGQPRLLGHVCRWTGYAGMLAAGMLLLDHLLRHHRSVLAREPTPSLPLQLLLPLAIAGVLLVWWAEGRRFPEALRWALGRARNLPPRAAAYLVLSLLAGLLALGPELKFFGYRGPWLPYGWIYEWFPGAGALRAPFRAGLLAQVFLAVVLAYGASRLLALCRSPGHPAWLAASTSLLLVAGMTAEYLGEPLPYDPLPRPASQVHAWLAREPGRFGVLEWPMLAHLHQTAREQWLSTRDWKGRVTGHNGNLPDDIVELHRRALQAPGEEFVEYLVERFPVRYLLAHRHRSPVESLPGGPDASRHRWELVREFGPDRIYRLRNGGPLGTLDTLERRFPGWMLRGLLQVRFAAPVPGDGTPRHLRVHLGGERLAEVQLDGNQREVRVPLGRDYPVRELLWLRLELLAPEGETLQVEAVRFLTPEGESYP